MNGENKIKSGWLQNEKTQNRIYFHFTLTNCFHDLPKKRIDEEKYHTGNGRETKMKEKELERKSLKIERGEKRASRKQRKIRERERK